MNSTNYIDSVQEYARDSAARHIDALEIAPGVWVYLAPEVRGHYTVTAAELARLGRALASPLSELEGGDSYSLWCQDCGSESTEAEVAAYRRIRPGGLAND